jgi:aminopeptidase N
LILKSLETLNILSNEPQITDSYALNIYPNPSSDEINVSYQLVKNAEVSLSIIDFSGKEIYVEKEEKKSQGIHSANIRISQFSAGTYIVNLRVDGLNESRKLVTIK